MNFYQEITSGQRVQEIGKGPTIFIPTFFLKETLINQSHVDFHSYKIRLRVVFYCVSIQVVETFTVVHKMPRQLLIYYKKSFILGTLCLEEQNFLLHCRTLNKLDSWILLSFASLRCHVT